VAKGSFFVYGHGLEEGFFAKDVAAPHHIAHALLVRVTNSHHEGTIENEVDLFNLTTLAEERLSLLDAHDLAKLDDELVCIVADPGQHFVMQPDFLQTEHLFVRPAVKRCLLELINKLLHNVLPAHQHLLLLACQMLTGQVLAVAIIVRSVVEAKDVSYCVRRRGEGFDWRPAVAAIRKKLRVARVAFVSG